MKAREIKHNAGKVSEIDGMKVLYGFHSSYEDFTQLTPALAHELQIPYEFAICRSEKSSSGVCVFGRYGGSWFRVTQYNEFVISHLISKINVNS